MKKNIWIGVFVILLMILTSVSVASAVSISVSPKNINAGDTVTISIQDLKNGSNFSFGLRSVIPNSGSGNIGFQITDLNVPFSLENPDISIKAEPAVSAGLKYTEGGSVKSIEFLSDKYPDAGVVNQHESLPSTITGGTISELQVFTTTKPGIENIDLSMDLTGGKTSGEESAVINFGIKGITNGNLRSIIFVNGTEVMNEEIIIGGGHQAGSNSGNNGGDSSSPEIVITSLDNIASFKAGQDYIAGAVLDQIEIINIGEFEVPEDWICLAGTYVISPDNLKFVFPVTLSMKIDDSILKQPDVYTPFIAIFDGDKWEQLPSKINDKVIEAEICDAGKYAFMSYKPVLSPAIAPVHAIKNTTEPTKSPEQTDETHKEQPLTANTTVPQPTTSGMPMIFVICSLFIALLIAFRVIK